MTMRLVALAAALALAGGCVNLSKPYPEIRYHNIEANAFVTGKFALPSGPEAKVVVRPFTISPAYDTRQFVWIEEGTTGIRRDYYNQFIVPPTEAVRDVVVGKLEQMGLGDSMVQPSSLLTADYAIEGHIERLALRENEGKKTRIDVSLHLILIDLQSPERRVVRMGRSQTPASTLTEDLLSGLTGSGGSTASSSSSASHTPVAGGGAGDFDREGGDTSNSPRDLESAINTAVSLALRGLSEEKPQ